MREIRFFPDFDRKYPLWESFSGKYAMEPEVDELSAGLAVEMHEFMKFWDSHFVETSNSFQWGCEENKQKSVEGGNTIIRRLRGELDSVAIVLDQRL